MKPQTRGRKEGAAHRVCYLGPDDECARHLRKQLLAAGHAFALPGLESGCDILIDRASTSPADARAATLATGPVLQYILVSSYRVYPAVPRLAPWRENEVAFASDLAPWSDPGLLQARALERELRILAGQRISVTILRPAPLEGGESDLGITAWMTERILDGERVVLPEGDLPSYRVCSMNDLANAIVAVAGQPESFGQIWNVVNPGVLGYWGHAALVRDGLGRNARFGYVPASRWRTAGLSLPGISLAPASLIAIPQGLLDLGWRPDDPVALIHGRARACAQQRQPSLTHTMVTERHLLAQVETEANQRPAPGQSAQPLPRHDSRQWQLTGWAGQPASLSLTRSAEPRAMPSPLVKVLALALHPAEERFLRGEYPQRGARALGHNAILEILHLPPEETVLRVGQRVLPVSALPCGDPVCRFCSGGRHGVLGIGCDGYGLGICSTPPGHLVPLPDQLGHAALLADPLASLTCALEDRLKADTAPVWIAGRTVEAALAGWLAYEAGRHVVHVDRRDWSHDEFPVTAIDPLLQRLRGGELSAPTLVLDFTGNAEVAWSLSHALAKGGHLYARRRPPGIAHGTHWHEMHAAAPNRAALETALDRLQQWSKYRDLNKRIGPAVPLDLYWDALLPAPFCQPYLEADA